MGFEQGTLDQVFVVQRNLYLLTHCHLPPPSALTVGNNNLYYLYILLNLQSIFKSHVIPTGKVGKHYPPFSSRGISPEELCGLS